ncbi:VanW family protein [Nonomuraea dietziae]|uniref:Vancomycin resistance protein YoaR n=1 Tax=Nonomuraea dietziae TaxID=65515 RepID=A0A7W5VMZ2_9ACTN|nr:VanW family protein [Nonomuraea dietziae]MBB3730937.1 vancomycin resistance protein YoaR [Nonomuraea dietziae]
MANARPIDPPTDPFASVPTPPPGNGRKPRMGGLPPGVSPDIYGPGAQRGPAPVGPGALPPVAHTPQPWPMNETQRHDAPPPPPPAFGHQDGPSEPPPPRQRQGRRLLPTIAVVLGVLVVLAYVVPAVVMSGSVLRGTKVGGVDIGGLTVTEAADRLRDELAPKVELPLAVEVNGRKETIESDEAGVELDVVGTIEQAPSGFPNPVEVWRALTGTTEIDPKVSVESAQLARTVETLAAKVDQKAREGRVAFKGTQPVSVTPRDGVVLDQEAAVKLISEGFLKSRETVSLPVKVDQPKTTPAAVKAAAATAAEAVSAPITLTRDGKQAQIPVAVIAANLTFVSDGEGGLEPRFDARKALSGIESQLIDAAQAPRDATYDVVGDKLKLISARKGKGVDDKRLATDVAKALQSGGSRTIPVELAVVAPRLTDSELRQMGIKEKVASFTTQHPCCQNRVTNIHLMADAVDGHIVKPGETFSINGLVGERTAAKGYLPAGQIVAGKMEDGVGGGVSQFATTMYNAAYFGGFQDVEHLAHMFWISRYPPGREATVFWPTVDLKWKNDSEYGVLVKTSYTGSSITVTLWSTKRYDKVESITGPKRNVVPVVREQDDSPDCKPTEGHEGFTIDVTRVITDEGAEVRRERKTTTYRMEKLITCVKPPSDDLE